MRPEHETFLLDHVAKMGFFFIIDCLKQQFPSLSHDEACTIFDEFEAKHAEDANVKDAGAELKQIGNEIGSELEKQIAAMEE